nr:hypothetical protein [Mycobacterium lepromatosis]
MGYNWWEASIIERCVMADEVGGGPLLAGQRAGLVLVLRDCRSYSGTGQLYVAVALDRKMPIDGTLCVSDLIIDAKQRLSGPTVGVVVVDDPVGGFYGLSPNSLMITAG